MTDHSVFSVTACPRLSCLVCPCFLSHTPPLLSLLLLLTLPPLSPSLPLSVVLPQRIRDPTTTPVSQKSEQQATQHRRSGPTFQTRCSRKGQGSGIGIGIGLVPTHKLWLQDKAISRTFRLKLDRFKQAQESSFVTNNSLPRMQASEVAGDQVRGPPKRIHAQYVLPEHTQTSSDVLAVIDSYAKTCVPRPAPQTDARETQLIKTWSLLVLVEYYRKSLASPPSLKGLEDETILSLLQTRIQETQKQEHCLIACKHLQNLEPQRWKRVIMSLFKATFFFYVRHTRTREKRSFWVQRTGTAIPDMEEEGRETEARQGTKDTREVCDHAMREFASFFCCARTHGANCGSCIEP